jgi:hypothetical protein
MTVKIRMIDVLNMLMLPKSSSHEQHEGGKEEDTKAGIRKTTIYLGPEASQILEDLANDRGRSRNTVINDAIIFYADRGQFLEKLIKTSIREALQDG